VPYQHWTQPVIIMGQDRLNILVLSTFGGGNANVIRDFLFSFNAYSRHRYAYVFDTQGVDEKIDFSAFDVILVFWSVYLLGEYFSPGTIERIGESDAIKVLFLQDEYRDVRPMNAVMARLGVNLMFTCVAEDQHELFYPKRLIPSLRETHTVLTGYVPSYLERRVPKLNQKRPLDVAYRSRAVPFCLGDLGQEKTVIAQRFAEICSTRGLKQDISVKEHDRIYGKKWVRFLESARTTLGTGSGASAVDFSGDIRRKCEAYLLDNPNAEYGDLRERFFKDIDGRVSIEAVSPRFFEAAALGCGLVMHEGPYSGILEPDRHFIAVKKDYSNIDEVVQKIRDSAWCRNMVENVHCDVIRSGKYSYRSFVQWFDQIIAQHVPESRGKSRISRLSFYTRQYFSAGQTPIPWGNGYFSLPKSLPRILRILRLILDAGTNRTVTLIRASKDPPASTSNAPGSQSALLMKMSRVFVLLRFAIRFPAVRAALWQGTFSPEIRRKAGWSQLLRDLLRASILMELAKGTEEEPAEVEVVAEHEDLYLRLLLIAYPTTKPSCMVTGGQNGRPASSQAQSNTGLRIKDFGERVKAIELDYHAVGSFIHYIDPKGRSYDLALERDGIYRFTALAALAQIAPETVLELILAIQSCSSDLKNCTKDADRHRSSQ